jgi:hypothetical protein
MLQLDVVHIFEQALGTKVQPQFCRWRQSRNNMVPAIRCRRPSRADVACAKGDTIRGAGALADEYRIALRSVGEYAAQPRAKQMRVA